MQRSFQYELSKCYQNRELIKFINRQLLQLPYLPEIKALQKFTIVKFRLPNITSTYRFTTDNHCIQFYIVLSKGFPVVSPRVHTKEALILPGINDCRDLLYNIIQTETWDYKITLKRIQQQIPKFLTQINKTQNIFYVARLGCFQLNNVYPMDLIRELRGQNIFFALQFTQESDFRMILMDVSSTHIAIFTTKQQPHYENDGFKIPQQKDITYCMLIFYAELGSVSQIYIDRNNFSDIHLTFTAKKPHNMNLQPCSKTKKIKVKKGLAFIHKMLKGIKYYDAPETSLSIHMENINEEQKLILKQIAQSQVTIERRMNVHTIKQLVDRYQAAVQYYSSHNIPYYEVYLDRITRLYQRKQVRTIMGTQISMRERNRTI